MKTLLLLSAVVVSLLNVHCQLTKSCTEMGCVDGAGGRATVHVSTKDLLASVVTICRNGECSTGKPSAPPCPGVSVCFPESVEASMTGPFRAGVSFIAKDTTQWDRDVDAAVPAVTDQTTSFDFVFSVS